ncbi:MAG: TonB-dependent receptor [Acidobacteriota bacterium]|nr:TonB-dependent receptor [Acidobacteriota bacterium]MDH3784008.1 TonB-dependent receptor [Acidobacteriota bacterium]
MVHHRKPFGSLTTGLRLTFCSILALAVMVLGSGPAHPANNPTFSGVIKDTIGNVVHGVEVLVVQPGGGPDPVAVGRSNRQGRFEFAGLLPGDYRVALLKEGYLTLIASVNTRLDQVLQVVLQPALSSANPDLPVDALSPDWALRLPRRSLLHDVEDTVHIGDLEQGGQPSPDALQMSLEQTVSMRAGATGSPEGHAGNGTRVRLASPVGDRGSVALTAYQERLGGDRSATDGHQRFGDSGMTVSMDYETTLDSRLEVNAFYAGQQFGTQLQSSATIPRERPQQRTWGYDARWSQQLNPSSRLDVSLDYVGTEATQARSINGPEMPGDLNQSVRAAGAYERSTRTNELQVAFHARSLDAPSNLTYGMATPALLGVDGFSVGIDAQDTRKIRGPIALIYGLGYQHALQEGDSALFAPRLGGVWSYGRFSVQTLFSYHAVTEWTDRESDLSTHFTPSSRLGYEVGVELPIVASLTLRGSTAFSPSQMDRFGYDGGLQGPSDPLYLTNGNAAVKESRVALVQDSGPVRAVFEVEHGWAEGTLAAWLPEEMPIRRLENRHMRFDSGQLGLSVVSSGTGILLDYRRTRENGAADDLLASGLKQRALELRLRQRVLPALTGGDWRLLIAYRRSDLELDSPDSTDDPDTGDAIVAGIHRRVSAGLSVQF